MTLLRQCAQGDCSSVKPPGAGMCTPASGARHWQHLSQPARVRRRAAAARAAARLAAWPRRRRRARRSQAGGAAGNGRRSRDAAAAGALERRQPLQRHVVLDVQVLIISQLLHLALQGCDGSSFQIRQGSELTVAASAAARGCPGPRNAPAPPPHSAGSGELDLEEHSKEVVYTCRK